MTRRANGEGSVYKRRDGRWAGSAYLPTTTGKLKRIQLYGSTRADVRLRLNARLDQAAKGIYEPDHPWKVGEYLDYWFTEVAGKTRKPKTMELYEGAIRLYLKPGLGTNSLTRLSVVQVQTFLNQQYNAGHSARTVQVMRCVLSAALTRAMREEIVFRNVARLVEVPTWERQEITPWTVEQLTQFLAVARDHQLFSAFVLLILYGLRRGEVLGLRLTDVDFANHQLHIRQQVQAVTGHVIIGSLKTSAGRRDLPLVTFAEHALAAHLRQRSSNTTSTDLVFQSTTGTPIEPNNFTRTFHVLRKRAGLPRIKLHHLRHTAATILKNVGVPARDAQLILGHAHVSTTQQLYQHGDNTSQRRGLALFEQALVGRLDTNSCQTQLSIHHWAKFLDMKKPLHNRGHFTGGPGGTRTHDILLKSSTNHTEDPALTGAILLVRARLLALLLGTAAVEHSCQNQTQVQTRFAVLTATLSTLDFLNSDLANKS